MHHITTNISIKSLVDESDSRVYSRNKF
eukprot:SAG31_NODE_11338_length_1041_cov_1.162420_1_plen_27_part_10